MDSVRRIIADRIKDRNLTYKEVSEALGRNHAYVQQFIERGIPTKLKENDRLKLSELLDLEEADIGGIVRKSTPTTISTGDVPSLDLVAGMGNGGLMVVEAKSGKVAPEYIQGHWSFPDPVKAMWQHMPATYAFPVTGDSMAPTLESGSYVFVDTTHNTPAPSDLYVLDYGDGLMVKRVELIPQSEMVRIISDSDRYQNYELQRETVQVFGRVVAWFHWRG